MGRKRKPSKKKVDAFVLDGSIALAWCFSDEADPYADLIARRFPGVEAVVPALWHLEVTNTFLVGERRQRSTSADTARWSSFLAALPITVDGRAGFQIVPDILTLARRHKLSAYDAAYIELALRRGLPLATLDDKLKAAAGAAGVPLFAP